MVASCKGEPAKETGSTTTDTGYETVTTADDTDTGDTVSGDTADTADTTDTSGGDTDETGETGETAAPPPRTLSSGSQILKHDGVDRTFELYLPADLPVGAPLVVVLHGYGGTGVAMGGYTGMQALADAEGFALVQPQSLVDAWGWTCWNVGYCDNDDVDDVGFLREVIELVRGDQGSGAVMVTGMSNGGDMSYRMGCEASDVVDVIAPVAGCLMTWLTESCAPGTPPPLVAFHGNGDPITLWDGDPHYFGGGYEGTLSSVGFIAGLHDAQGYETEAFDDVDGSRYVVHSWSTKAADVPVQLYEVEDGRHDWPTLPGDDYDASAVMWEFFVARIAPW